MNGNRGDPSVTPLFFLCHARTLIDRSAGSQLGDPEGWVDTLSAASHNQSEGREHRLRLSAMRSKAEADLVPDNVRCGWPPALT